MLSPGTSLGAYEIVTRLGAGGMGEVYRARDARLGRDVAIKVLAPQRSNDAESLLRFERETRAVAALSHPNIVSIFDTGTADGITYAVTELLEGETLRDRLGRGPLQWRTAAAMVALIADALRAAHAKGIVHRDLKPENIFLAADGRVKVLDFGLAQWHVDAGPDDVTRGPALETQSGLLLGTVGYMSPEQVRGAPVGPRSDVFALGCVLYEMVTARRPFARATTPETLAAILGEAPLPLVQECRQCPDALRVAIERCLEKDPARRMQSMQELEDVLTTLSNATAPSQARSAPRRARAVVIGSVAALLILVFGVAWHWMGSPRPARSIAVLPFENANGGPDVDYIGDGITEALINSLSAVPNLSVVSRNAVFKYKGHAGDAQSVAKALNADVVVAGRVVQRGDALSISAELVDARTNLHLWGQQFDRQLDDVLGIQREIAAALSDSLRLNLSGKDKARFTRQYTENKEAYQLYLKGRYYWNKKTADGFSRGVEFFSKAIEADPDFAPAYAAQAALYTNLANYNFALMPAREAWSKARTAAVRAIQIDDTLAAAHASLALVAYQWEWNWPEAEREFKRALDLDPGSSSTYDPGPSSTNHWYTHYLMSMGRTDESLKASRRALELDPVDPANNAHQGWHYLFTRRYDEAIVSLKKAIEMDPDFVVSHWYLGLAYEQTGAYQEAIDQFAACVRLTNNRTSMSALLGHAYAVAGQKREAKAILDELLKPSTAYVPPYPVAAIYAALGDRDAAFLWLERAYAEKDSWMDYLGVDPRLDMLRGDPRLIALLQRMNLSESAAIRARAPE